MTNLHAHLLICVIFFLVLVSTLELWTDSMWSLPYDADSVENKNSLQCWMKSQRKKSLLQRL